MADRIGEYFVRIGAMTQEQVDEVLDLQHRVAREGDEVLFGILAKEKGYIDRKALKRFSKRDDDDAAPVPT